jgi:hypothetical protein
MDWNLDADELEGAVEDMGLKMNLDLSPVGPR